MRIYNVLILFLFCFTSCQLSSTVSPEQTQNSGPNIEVKSPGILKKYNSFYISDIQVYSVDGDYLRRIDDREVRILADDFRRKLIKDLGSLHATIPQPSKNTAVIKVALTDVATNYAAFQLRPGVIMPNTMRGGASIDATIPDSVSKEPLVRVRDSRSGQRQGFLSGLGKWDGAKQAFDEWSQMLSDATRN